MYLHVIAVIIKYILAYTTNTQIHQQLVEQNLWGNRLKAFSWRIDVKTKARHIEQLNQPTAIMELQLSTCDEDTSEVFLSIDQYFITIMCM